MEKKFERIGKRHLPLPSQTERNLLSNGKKCFLSLLSNIVNAFPVSYNTLSLTLLLHIIMGYLTGKS